jgi:hypothetical protein
MDLNKYLNSDALNKAINDYAGNAKLETTGKTLSNFKAIAADAFNEGIMSMISQKNAPKKGSLEKSKELTQMLPDFFCRSDLGQTAIKNIIESINSNQTESVLNIGFEELVRRDIENMIRIVYAIGVTTGFEVASDADYKSMYLANKERFIMHGSVEKKDVAKSTPKEKTIKEKSKKSEE